MLKKADFLSQPYRFKTNYLSALPFTQISSFRFSTPRHKTHFSFLPVSSLNTSCINGHLQDSLFQMALQGQNMKFRGYDSLLTECIDRKSFTEGQRVHAHMIKTRYLPPVYLNTRLMVLYMKCDHLGDARQVFDGMTERSIVSWTAMITGYTQKGCSSEALDLFVQMMQTDTLPNEFTFTSVLKACTGTCGLDHGRQVHSLLIKSSFESHIFVGSSLLDMYAKAGEILEARLVFNNLPEKDVVSCTAIIAGYSQLGLDEEALELFCQLQKEGMQSNYVTYVSVLTSLSGLAALDYGRQVHNKIIRSQLPFYVVLENSLIDMYSKCGSLIYSRRVFENVLEKTVITWNAMLVAYAKHGLGKQVLQLFRLMKRKKEVKPDNISYMAVLSGCSHGGLVEEGLDIFDAMVYGKDVEPDIQHYGCVVDLLGRAGKIEKALEFIKKMPWEPTTAIWASLLGACRLHANAPIGEYVAWRLFKLDPRYSGTYVILSNIYAAVGRWEDAIKVRGMMMEKALVKEAGRSWINLGKMVHTFHAGDKFHPAREEIYAKLKELSGKMKAAGYVPDLSCVLHDVDDEQKERILLTHCEKLAIGFALIFAPKGALIRVVKNLRVCVDCHNFAKFVSKICRREISLRDTSRFHHIGGGVCSCGDYW